MIAIQKRCPDCGGKVPVYPGDEFADCDNPVCPGDGSFRVLREGDNISLRHLPWHRVRPATETKLHQFQGVRS